MSPRAKRPSELLPSGEYERMLAAQGGSCAIVGCKRTAKTRRFPIDHDHKTGAIRGILCHWHNRLLPVGVTPDDLRAMADYLENHEEMARVGYGVLDGRTW